MHVDTKLPNLGRVISRKKLDGLGASEHTVGGRPVLAGTIVHSDTGFAIVLLVDGSSPVIASGHTSERAAYEKLWDLIDRPVPDFLADDSYTPPKPKRSRARAQVVETATPGRTARHHGRVDYVITADTEGPILYAARRLMKEWGGYGMSFGELETIDGVLTLRGYRKDNCD
jgi:hypothetical protein